MCPVKGAKNNIFGATPTKIKPEMINTLWSDIIEINQLKLTQKVAWLAPQVNIQ